MSGAGRLALLAALTFAAPAVGSDETVVVGSKKFTESVVLGEIAVSLLRDAGVPASHRRELGGTRILFGALERGSIDVYTEYTGTLTHEILRGSGLSDRRELHDALEIRGIRMTRPLGFDNAYAMGMRPDTAERLGIGKISDLGRHPGLRLGLGNEFMDRGDGWPSLREHYGLPQQDVRGLDHDLAYRALDAGDIDVMDLYATDAEIDYYGLRVLEDDRSFFRSYEAVLLYRADLERRAPAALASLRRLEGRLDATRVRRLNARVKLEGETESRVAASWLREELGLQVALDEPDRGRRLLRRTREHLFLCGIAMLAGIATSIPLGIAAARYPRAGQAILGTVSVIQTIPALALLVLMIPLLGIYEPPAIAALYLYSLLPMVRNTYTGLRSIPQPLRESAEALGLSARDRLFRIELPLASPAILAGIRTSTVIVIGFATLGALIGAGGYGQPIFTGIRLDDFGLILEGALPAAGMALATQLLFSRLERWVIPRGIVS